MKDGKVLIDINVIVYAYDISASEKHSKAVEIMKKLWNTDSGITNTQVMQKFFVNVTRKITKPLDTAIAKWKTVIVDGETIMDAIDTHSDYKYSFWDSLIIASAIGEGAGTLFPKTFRISK